MFTKETCRNQRRQASGEATWNAASKASGQSSTHLWRARLEAARPRCWTWSHRTCCPAGFWSCFGPMLLPMSLSLPHRKGLLCHFILAICDLLLTFTGENIHEFPGVAEETFDLDFWVSWDCGRGCAHPPQKRRLEADTWNWPI